MHNSRPERFTKPPRKDLTPFEIEHQLPKTSAAAKAAGFKAEPTLLNDSLFGINSTYLEAIDQGHSERGPLPAAMLFTLGMLIFCCIIVVWMCPSFFYALRGLDVDLH